MSPIPTTKAQLQTVVKAVHAANGNRAEAARRLGMPSSTVQNHYDRAVETGLVTRMAGSASNGNSGSDLTAAKIAKSVADLIAAKQVITAKDKTIKQLEDRLEKLNKSKWRLPKAKKPKRGGSYVRIAIPDTHGAHVDEAAMGAFLGDLEALAPREIVLLGDHLDCGGFLAQHQTLGYVAETTFTFEDDINAGNQFLDKVQEICPKAAFHYLEGNHERRIERWCVTQALKITADAKLLLDQFSTDVVLHLVKRDIPIYKQGQHYQGLPIPATIKLGHCYFTHGSRTGMTATKNMLNDFAGNVVFGHIHQITQWHARTIDAGMIMAASPGCLCTLQPKYMHSQLTRWGHGYGVQLVNPDGSFLHINVPIIDGKSYLIALADRLG